MKEGKKSGYRIKAMQNKDRPVHTHTAYTLESRIVGV
jgi:hypothetical protein